MRQVKRLFYIILINILVSAATVFLVLNYWEKRDSSLAAPGAEALTPVVLVITATSPDIPATEAVSIPIAAAQDNPPKPSEPAPQITPTNAPEVIQYQVREGDTLGSISVQFDVSVETIMALNEISDPNTVYLGQILLIPTGELEAEEAAPDTATEAPPTATPSETPPPTTIPTPTTGTPSGGGQVAVEIVSVISPGDFENERVRISRSGEGELSLANWSLTDDDGNNYIFPQLFLYTGGAVDVHTKAGLNTVVDLYWGLAAPVWEPGEQAILRDEQGEVRATYRVP